MEDTKRLAEAAQVLAKVIVELEESEEEELAKVVNEVSKKFVIDEQELLQTIKKMANCSDSPYFNPKVLGLLNRSELPTEDYAERWNKLGQLSKYVEDIDFILPLAKTPQFIKYVPLIQFVLESTSGGRYLSELVNLYLDKYNIIKSINPNKIKTNQKSLLNKIDELIAKSREEWQSNLKNQVSTVKLALELLDPKSREAGAAVNCIKTAITQIFFKKHGKEVAQYLRKRGDSEIPGLFVGDWSRNTMVISLMAAMSAAASNRAPLWVRRILDANLVRRLRISKEVVGGRLQTRQVLSDVELSSDPIISDFAMFFYHITGRSGRPLEIYLKKYLRSQGLGKSVLRQSLDEIIRNSTDDEDIPAIDLLVYQAMDYKEISNMKTSGMVRDYDKLYGTKLDGIAWELTQEFCKKIPGGIADPYFGCVSKVDDKECGKSGYPPPGYVRVEKKSTLAGRRSSLEPGCYKVHYRPLSNLEQVLTAPWESELEKNVINYLIIEQIIDKLKKYKDYPRIKYDSSKVKSPQDLALLVFTKLVRDSEMYQKYPKLKNILREYDVRVRRMERTILNYLKPFISYSIETGNNNFTKHEVKRLSDFYLKSPDVPDNVRKSAEWIKKNGIDQVSLNSNLILDDVVPLNVFLKYLGIPRDAIDSGAIRDYIGRAVKKEIYESVFSSLDYLIESGSSDLSFLDPPRNSVELLTKVYYFLKVAEKDYPELLVPLGGKSADQIFRGILKRKDHVKLRKILREFLPVLFSKIAADQILAGF